MTQVLVPLADVIAICVLALVLYYRRYRRRDLTMAYLAVNVGVMGVAIALSATPINAGIGFGLFGVLALVRLRSETLSQREIAYYFCALALGVIGGLGAYHGWLSAGLMALIVVVIAIADSRTASPLTPSPISKLTLTLAHASADQSELAREVEAILGAPVVDMRVDKVDFVRGLTVVDVRYESRPLSEAGTPGYSVRPEATVVPEFEPALADSRPTFSSANESDTDQPSSSEDLS
ncbi:MAG: DUF4956 domain-containing protein [Propionibacteriaceae bacterium]|jgi:hypothetical protein|nr:DUF4956 domain-containing protein [Propionibacteriaceae bacterium]